jgi:hypothetical protein
MVFAVKNLNKLIADVAQKCVAHGITLSLQHTEKVDEENLACSGYFDEQSLVVATKKKKIQDWVDVLVHESCHLDQFTEKSELWVSDNNSLFVVESWIKGKKMSLAKRDVGFNNTILLELDCEKRSIKKFKKYKLNIDIEDYIQKANSYLFSYMIALHEKRWYASPYENPKIYKKMPKTLLTLKEYIDGYWKYKHLYK